MSLNLANSEKFRFGRFPLASKQSDKKQQQQEQQITYVHLIRELVYKSANHIRACQMIKYFPVLLANALNRLCVVGVFT